MGISEEHGSIAKGKKANVFITNEIPSIEFMPYAYGSDLIDTVDLNAYTYARHTSVSGIEKVVKPDQDWALEYEYRPAREDILSSKEVEEMTTEMEDVVWTECPRLLHPIYRLVSPWNYAQDVQDAKEEEYALSISSLMVSSRAASVALSP